MAAGGLPARVLDSMWIGLIDRITHYASLEDHWDYPRWLPASDVVVNTAIGGNLGVSIIEAVPVGYWPIPPCRLSCPQILTRQYHSGCLCDGADDLFEVPARWVTGGMDPGKRDAVFGRVCDVHNAVRRATNLHDALEAVALWRRRGRNGQHNGHPVAGEHNRAASTSGSSGR